MKILKSVLFVSAMGLSASLSFGEYKELPTYDCADVTFSCGATGYVCGNANESLVARAWRLDAQICGESLSEN